MARGLRQLHLFAVHKAMLKCQGEAPLLYNRANKKDTSLRVNMTFKPSCDICQEAFDLKS